MHFETDSPFVANSTLQQFRIVTLGVQRSGVHFHDLNVVDPSGNHRQVADAAKTKSVPIIGPPSLAENGERCSVAQVGKVEVILSGSFAEIENFEIIPLVAADAEGSGVDGADAIAEDSTDHPSRAMIDQQLKTGRP